MGVNIWVTKILSVEEEETWSGKKVSYYKTEDQEWFDSLRHTGDRDFITARLFVDIDEDRGYCRPENFDTTRQWGCHTICIYK